VSASAGDTGTIVVQFPTGASAKAGAPTAFRFTGTDATGQVVFGPQSFPAAPVVVMQVPIGTVSLLMQPLDANLPIDALESPVRFDARALIVLNDPLHTFASAASLAIAPSAPPTLAVGQTQAFTATATFPDGSHYPVTDTVAWSSADPTVATVSAFGVATAAARGTSQIGAALDGLASSATLTIGNTSVAVASAQNPSLFGQSVTFTATVTATSGSPSGTVTFMDGATAIGSSPVGGGQASLSTSSLPRGVHTITAVFAGGSGFDPATSPALEQTVTGPTGTVLVSSLNPSVVGQAVTFTATVASAAGTPTGTVTFNDGTTVLGTSSLSGGQASFSTSALSVGTHGITAVFTDGVEFSTSTSNAVAQVVVPVPTTTTLVSDLNPATFGQTVTFTANVASAAGTPTGTVTFKDGAATLGTSSLSGGQASLSTSALSGGAHSITAVFTDGVGFAASASNPIAQVVVPAATTTTLVIDLNPAPSGQTVTLTATVASANGTPTGTVTFFEGATPLGSNLPLTGGQASFQTSFAAGNHSLTAMYSATSDFSASTSSPLVETVGSLFFCAGDVEQLTLGGSLGSFAGGFSQPVGLAFDSQGNLYVSDVTLHQVFKLPPGGTPALFASGSSNLRGIAVDGSDNVYVADGTQIMKITPGGVSTVFATGFGKIEGIGFGPSGHLFVADFNFGWVTELDGAGQTVSNMTGFNSPFDVAFDASGNLYVSSFVDQAILKVTLPGGTTTQYVGGLSASAKGLAFDPNGNLYVVTGNGSSSVVRVPPGGGSATTVASGLANGFLMVFH
jgi:sugar lactone lactonase YvrE